MEIKTKMLQKLANSVALVSGLLFSAMPADAQITPGTQMPDLSEQASLALINRFRADPRGELARILDNPDIFDGIIAASTPYGSDGTAWSSGFWSARDGAGAGNTAAAMDFFQVSPGALKAQWNSLPTAGVLHPLSWNGNLGQSSQGYAQLVVADAGVSNPHLVAPYTVFDFDRYNDAGYVNVTTVGENIAPNFANNMSYQHAGFAVDWGNPYGGGQPGIQNPAGHRDSMLSMNFTEIGIGVVAGWGAGNSTQVQHFGKRFASVSEYAWGYVYRDIEGSMYSLDAGLEGVEVRLGSLIGTTDANGGFMLPVETLANGSYTIEYWQGGEMLGSNSINIANHGLYAASLFIPVPEVSSGVLMIAALGLSVVFSRRR